MATGKSLLTSTFKSLLSGSNAPSTGSDPWSAPSGNSSWSIPKTTSSSIPVFKPATKAANPAAAVKTKFGITDLDKAGKKSKKKKGHESILGGILGGAADVAGNLVSDSITTAEELGPGLLKLATTNPEDSVKAIAKSYAQNYGKLFHGDVGGFLHQVEQHPLGYLLDASTLGTGGGAILGRLVPNLAKGGEAALRVDRASVAAGEAQTVSKQLSRNVFTRNVYEKPGYALQRLLPARTPVIGETSTAVRHITGQLESAVGKVSHTQHVFEKNVRDLRHANQKDDSVLHAFDKVNADLRNKTFKPEGSAFAKDNNPVPFNPKTDVKLNEVTKSSPKIDALADHIKSELQFDAAGNLVAKEGASAATHSFLKLNDARTSLNNSVLKANEMGDTVMKSASEATAKRILHQGGTNVGKKVAKPTVSGLQHTPDRIEIIPAHRKITPAEFSHYKDGQQVWTKEKSTWVPEQKVVHKGDAKYTSNSDAANAVAKQVAPKHGGVNARITNAVRAAANSSAPKTASYLDGIRTVDTHSDPVANYLEMHSKALGKIGNDISKSFIDQYGKSPALTQELANLFDKKSAAGSLTGQYNKATQLWKDVILVGRPAFLVNNFVGNQVMYHLKNGTGGVALQQAAKGELNKIFDKHFFEHRTSLGESEKAIVTDPLQAESRYRRNANRVYDVQSRHEQVLRKATMREVALTIPAIKTEMKNLMSKDKLSQTEALGKAMDKAFASPEGAGYKQIISKGIDDTMGNYRHYNRFEEQLKKIVPFYGWNRHALRTYSSILKDQPGTANVISNISNQGAAENAKMFPGTPSFMGTYVTGSLGTFDTQALNPLKGGSDSVKAIKELISGKPGQLPTIASNLNPILGGIAQGLTGVNMTTGAPIKSGIVGGLVGTVGQQIIGGLPQVKTVNHALGLDDGGNRKDPHFFLTPTGMLKKKFLDSEGKVKLGPDGLPMEAGDRHMINQSNENNVLNWLGIPKRDVNLKTAQIVAKSIDTKRNGPGEFHNRAAQTKKIKAILAHKPKAAKHTNTF